MNLARFIPVLGSLVLLLIAPHAAEHRHGPSAPLRASTKASQVQGDATLPHRDEEAHAQSVLDSLGSRYRYLDGVTVSIGATPNGEEAIAYYAEGRIVISDTHTVGISTILDHEIWHVIDWRDNGSLDWGEQVPPDDSERYLKP